MAGRRSQADPTAERQPLREQQRNPPASSQGGDLTRLRPGLGCPAEPGVFRMSERGGDVLLAEVGAVVSLDQQRDTTAVIDVARPGEGAVEHVEFACRAAAP